MYFMDWHYMGLAMTTLQQRLHTFFAQPGIRKWAPASLLAATTGIILGTVAANPALAQTGVGLVLSGVAINLASGLLQPILDATDDDQRAELIEAQLNQPETARLSAAALLEAAPVLAEVLPASSSAGLITNLEQAMLDAGGALAKIAPGYAAALRNPPASWARLQQQLIQVAATSLIDIEVGDDNRIENLRIDHTQQPGDATIKIKGGDRTRISGVGITQTGTKPAARTCPDCGSSVSASATSCPTCGLSFSKAPLQTILAAFANPTGSSNTNWEREAKALRTALAPHPERFRIELLHDCSVDELHQALLRHRPDILHIQSHGTSVGIQLQDQIGDPHIIGWRELMQTLANAPSLRCVVLNACESAVHRQVGPTHFDLITTPGTITTEVTQLYTAAFYEAYAAGISIAECHRAGCDRVGLHGLTKEQLPERSAAR
jgi:hypothetical protein